LETKAMKNVIAALMLALLASASASASVYQAEDPEPTPEETLILELINRFRADPSAEADLLIAYKKSGQGRFVNVDWDMFASEMKALKKAPPLVFDLRLLDAARKHSHYMILNELTHVEESGKPGFVAEGFGARVKAAGFKGGAGGENCFRDASNPTFSHFGFTVDFGRGGEGGMQLGRGHRRNMHNPGFKMVGPGALPHRGRLSVTHNFGSNRGNRLVGGVIYTDKNGNEFYDVGEGRAGVTIKASDGSTARTWKSGAFTLELKSKSPAIEISAEFAGIKLSKPYEAGSQNVKFDWNIPAEADVKEADKLIAAAEKAGSETAKRKALVALHMGAEGLNVDAARQAKIVSLIGDVGEQVANARQGVRQELDDYNYSAFKKAVREAKKVFRGTAIEGWIKESEYVFRAKQYADSYAKRTVNATGSIKRTLSKAVVRQLEGIKKLLKTPDFIAELDTLIKKCTAEGTAPRRPRRGRSY
jgi:hypothetical protein